MKILVTGGNGQLGSELKLLTNHLKNCSFGFHDIDTLDILNEKSLNDYFSSQKPDIVVNCAAYTAVDKAETDKENALKVNCTIVKNLVNECNKLDAKLIHISTDYVFNGFSYKPYIEEDKTNPQSVYGKTKLLGEQEALKYKNSVIIRTSWLYSRFGNNFVKTMIRLGSEKELLNIISDQVGTPTYATDLARAIIRIIEMTIENPVQFVPGVYHYSNEGVCSWYDFTKSIIELKGIKCIVNPIETKDYPLPAKRPQYSVFNKTKIKTTFGLEIPYWRDSLKECLKKL